MRVYPGTTIADIEKTHVSGVLEVRPLDSVAQVEKELNIRFGLLAQVFWKDKDVWRETTGLDDLTLKELNEMGRNSSDEFIVSDYDEGFQEDEGFDRPVIE